MRMPGLQYSNRSQIRRQEQLPDDVQRHSAHLGSVKAVHDWPWVWSTGGHRVGLAWVQAVHMMHWTTDDHQERPACGQPEHGHSAACGQLLSRCLAH